MEKEYIKITDFAAINDADIGISRVNVIGGVNSSGKTVVSKLLYCFLKSQNTNNLEELLLSEGLSDCSCIHTDFSFKKYTDVIYLENVSVLDLDSENFLNSAHITQIRKCLQSETEDRFPEITSEIQKIINHDCMGLSSAGIKQIGIIQILLSNGSLQRDSFLIIDEPESNLHPDWQIRFAEILIILAKELDITLYLNSYSPIFIEALSLYAQYYGLIKNTNFYLTHRLENGRFTFRKISPKNMGEVYENLTRPYDELDKLKARILFRES